MQISYMAMNRMVEDRAATDDAYRRSLGQKGRPFLSDGRAMSDETLLAKLKGLGLDANRDCLIGTFPRFTSAEGMAKAMIADARTVIPDAETDWVWIALTCLWERWRPDLANTEMLEDAMHAGYAALARRDSVKACEQWLAAWRAILDIMARSGIDSLGDFDAIFGGTQCVFNWVQDLEMELHNAGLENPQFFRERIALCEAMIGRFCEGFLPPDYFKSALAGSHFELGDRQTGDHLFRRWLLECPQWGGGWIGWADAHWLFAAERNKDAQRAEEILKEGLAASGLDNRNDILERLVTLYEGTGRWEEAAALRQEIQQAPAAGRMERSRPQSGGVQMRRVLDLDEEELPKPARSLTLGPPAPGGLVDHRSRVGRNEPCPCGSGKKYKKCCGRRAL